MNIDFYLRRFRSASRELFNGYFRPIKDQENWSDSNALYASFIELEQALFKKLVSEPAELKPVVYGDVQDEIGVGGYGESDCHLDELLGLGHATCDLVVHAFPKDSTVAFVRFLDPEPLKCFDNQMVQVEIRSCPAYRELEGKRVLMQYCSSKFHKF